MVPTSAGIPFPPPRCCPGLHQGDQGFNKAVCSGGGWGWTSSSCRHGGIAQDPRRSAACVSPCAAAQTAGTRRYPHPRAASSAWGAWKGPWMVTELGHSDDVIAKPRWALGCPERLARPKGRTGSSKPGLSLSIAGSSRQPLIGAPVSGSCWTAYAPKVCNHLLFGQCCTLGYRNNAVFA